MNNKSDQNNIIETKECREGPDTRRESMCSQCDAKFDFRNDRFKHLDQEGHTIISDGKKTSITSTSTELLAREVAERPDEEIDGRGNCSATSSRTLTRLTASASG